MGEAPFLGGRPSWPLAGWKPALLKEKKDALHRSVMCSSLDSIDPTDSTDPTDFYVRSCGARVVSASAWIVCCMSSANAA